MSPCCVINGIHYMSRNEAASHLCITAQRFTTAAKHAGIVPCGYYVNHLGGGRVDVWSKDRVEAVGVLMGLR